LQNRTLPLIQSLNIMSIFQLCLVFLLGVGTSFVFISPAGVSIKRPKDSHPVRYSAIIWGFILQGSLPLVADAGMRSETGDGDLRTGEVDTVDIFVSPKVRLETIDTVSSHTLIPFALGMLAGYLWLWLKVRQLEKATHSSETTHDKNHTLNCQDWRYRGYGIIMLAWVFFFNSF